MKIGQVAFLLALATAIALSIGFGIAIVDLQNTNAVDRTLLIATQVQAAQQQALLAGLIPVAPTRTVLQSGVYNLFLDWGLGFIGFASERILGACSWSSILQFLRCQLLSRS